MKNLYTSLILVLVTTITVAQDYAMNTNQIYDMSNQIALIENKQNEAVPEIDNATKDDSDFRYYYFPNMYAYFDLETNKYIYNVNNTWESAFELPRYYGGYSLFKNTRIPIKNFAGDNPQQKLDEHKKQFPYIKKSRMLKSMNLDGNTTLTSLN